MYCPFGRSALYRTARHTFYEVTIEDKVDRQDRKDTKHGACDQDIVVVTIWGQQRIQTNLKSNLLVSRNTSIGQSMLFQEPIAHMIA